ncbi:MAG: hypothetical protein P0S95_05435 [Rhabdochlamydiaceae bacterium]|nr:hypothetical protein [Candidatus Amphrikana amoebophyrae]
MLVSPTADTTATEIKISNNPSVSELAATFFPPNPYTGNGKQIAASYTFNHNSIPKITQVIAAAIL